MSTEHDFTAVFGPGRGRLVSHPDPVEAQQEWISCLIRHFAVAPDDYIRELAHLSLTVYAEDFCYWASEEAVRIAWRRFPQQTQAMVADLDRAVWGRLSELDSDASCTGVVLEIAFCMVARDGLSSDQIEIVRSVLWHTDPSIDEKLGQRPLNEW